MAGGLEFTAVRPIRAYERIVEQVEQAIVGGEIQPGGRLPSERELMATFAVSRATVREALRVLESLGLVRSRPGDPRGPEVLQATPDLLNKAVTRLIRLNTMGLQELIEFRLVLEGSACALAAAHRSDEQLEAMRASVEAMGEAVEGSADAFSQADLAFHSSIWVASRNGLIAMTGEAVRAALGDLIAAGIDAADDGRARMRASYEHDREIFLAIEAGQGESASRLARRFIYDRYAGFVPEEERGSLRALLG